MWRLLAAIIVVTVFLGAATASAALLIVDGGRLGVYTYPVHLEPMPEPPSGLDCRLLPFFRARLEWTASPSPAVDGYRIYHRGPLQEAFSVLDEMPGASTTYDELRPSFLDHRYFVTAFLGSQESDPSNTIEVHCRPRLFSLPGPCDLSAENHGSQRTIELAWAEVADATEYGVFRATTSGGPYEIVGTTAATTHTDPAVSEGVTYYYVVVALDADGNESDPSPEVTVPDVPPSPPPPPALPPAPAPTPPPPDVPTVEYTVRPGERVADVAVFFGTTVETIVALNGLTNPNLVVPGQRLLVPEPPAAASAPAPTFTSEYVVQPGENLTDIAARFGTTVEALAAANSLANPSAICIGDRLLVP